MRNHKPRRCSLQNKILEQLMQNHRILKSHCGKEHVNAINRLKNKGYDIEDNGSVYFMSDEEIKRARKARGSK